MSDPLYEPGDSFYAFLVPADGLWGRHVVIARINPESDVLPRDPEDPEVQSILLCTRPLGITKKILRQTFERAERVTEKLNKMTLSVQIADLDGTLQELFDELWTTTNRGA